jgi:preprotein translocase subunit SecA
MVMKTSAWKHYIRNLQGSSVRFDVSRYQSSLAGINELEPAISELSDDEILRRGMDLQRRARTGEPGLPECLDGVPSSETLRGECFALVREAARRALGQRPFDEQVLAALAMHEGHVVEMQTGEGKTLAAVMPAALNALTGRGVHVLTFNDYLAQRDAAWMGPIYRRLGLSVGYVQQGMSGQSRRAAYRADITYVTAKEAGFDHLRDLLATSPAELVHREFHAALVDEADSLLIDEAGIPLVIAGSVARDASLAPRLARLIAALSPGVHFSTDEYARNVELTDAGLEYVERALECDGLHDADGIPLLTEVNCALHAQVLLRRDADYIVRNGRIEMIDEHTGRVVVDRHWPDGLQAAIEAKEGLEPGADGRILGSLTLQRFLRGYSRLCGMTGTARDAAEEMKETYGLDVVVIPTHRPVARIDRDDLVFTHREAKERAVVEEIRRAHATGRPVLVGTSTVTESERLADRLRETGIVCDVLNAKNDAEEAPIVARAGAVGAVTISTNMAGRGTDIRLGGEHEADRDRVAALGGLYVIGTNRHESRRVDHQLRGRAGRQGDPGESRFFVSLEDDLLLRYRTRGLIPARFMPDRSDAPIAIPVVSREIARTQRIVEGQNFEIRRTLARYAHVVERQHARLMGWRVETLHDRDLPEVERAVTLACIDRAWCDHLAFCAELREGIHLVRLGGGDPLSQFSNQAIRRFASIDEEIEDAVRAALPQVRIVAGEIDLTGAGLTKPSSTWTYLVNDDPFRDRMSALLMGPGGVTMAIYSAAVLMPMLVAWGVVERYWRHRTDRR